MIGEHLLQGLPPPPPEQNKFWKFTTAYYSGDFSKLGGLGPVGQVIFSLCGTGHPEGFQREWNSKLNSDLIYFLFSILEYAWDCIALTQKMVLKVSLGVYCVL